MSLAEAHSALGVAQGSKFDLVSAKNRALADARGDGEKLAKVRFEEREFFYQRPSKLWSLFSGAGEVRSPRAASGASKEEEAEEEQRERSFHSNQKEEKTLAFATRPRRSLFPTSSSKISSLFLALSSNRSNSPTTSS